MRLLALALLLGGCATAVETGASEDQLVGGKADARWAASGYLVKGSDTGKVACGATLIAPNVVVTAAHCVTEEAAYAFGTGELGSKATVRVAERHAHPDFHPTADGSFDITHTLRLFDVAYLVLEKNITDVVPAELSDEEPSSGCTIQAIGYGTENGKTIRKSTPACVMFALKLGSDPIFEVMPDRSSALCVADGDEGSAVVDRNPDHPKLIGIFVGSITAGLTDCKKGTQALNGYESAFGYSTFLREGIARAKR